MSFEGAFTWAAPFGALTAIVAAAAMVGVVVRDARRTELRSLVVLRCISALCVVAVAAQPAWIRPEAGGEPGRVAILLDRSASMRLGDAGDTRWDAATTLVRRWAESGVEARFHTFGAELATLGPESLDGVSPDGATSDLRAALAELAEGADEEHLGAIVVVSDGAVNDAAVPDALAQAGIRVHGVGVGERGVRDDDAITALDVDPVAYLRQPLEVRIAVRRIGASTAPPVVELVVDGRRVATQTITLDADGRGEAVASVTPRALGRLAIRATLRSRAGDAISENDARAVIADVRRDRLRVLHVSGHPSWDTRGLRGFLERDATLDLVAFFILRTTSDLTMADSSEMALIPFPTDELFEEHLGSFDVVIFQDFDYAPYGLAPHLGRIREYVRRGGSFAMIGGERSFADGGYAGTPVGEALPVELPTGGPTIAPERFRAEVAEALARHPIVALEPTVAGSRALFGRLAAAPGANLVARAKEGAHVLLVHPSRRDETGAPMPVLVTGSFGEGRVLALAMDGSYRWGMPTAAETGDASVHARFWDRALRWLARDPTLAARRVFTDRSDYAPGAPIRVEARLRDDRHQPVAHRETVVAIVDEEGRRVTSAEAATDAEGRVEAALEAPTDGGLYRAEVIVRDAPELGASVPFVVAGGGHELAEVAARPEALRALAEASAGRFDASPEDAPELDRYDRRRAQRVGWARFAPFSSPWAVFAVIALLFVEWVLRRRAGLS